MQTLPQRDVRTATLEKQVDLFSADEAFLILGLDKNAEQKIESFEICEPVELSQNSENLSKPNVSEKKESLGFSFSEVRVDDGLAASKKTEQVEKESEKPSPKKRGRPKKLKNIVLETPNYDFIQTSSQNADEEKDLKAKRNAKARFRLKLCMAVYGVLVAVCVGWVAFNGVALGNVSGSIADTEFKINQIQYIIKISQTDSYKDVADGKDTLISSVIEVTPPALVQPSEIQPKTNVFDRICNWISSIFGG